MKIRKSESKIKDLLQKRKQRKTKMTKKKDDAKKN